MLHLKISFLFLSESITGYLELVSYTSDLSETEVEIRSPVPTSTVALRVWLRAQCAVAQRYQHMRS